MENVDHVASRVSISAAVGFFASFVVWRGYSLRSTAVKVAGSCAIASTSLFGTERLAYLMLQSQNIIEEPSRLTLTSHATAGLVGGMWTAHLRGQRENQNELWAVLMFQAWLKSING